MKGNRATLRASLRLTAVNIDDRRVRPPKGGNSRVYIETDRGLASAMYYRMYSTPHNRVAATIASALRLRSRLAVRCLPYEELLYIFEPFGLLGTCYVPGIQQRVSALLPHETCSSRPDTVRTTTPPIKVFSQTPSLTVERPERPPGRGRGVFRSDQCHAAVRPNGPRRRHAHAILVQESTLRVPRLGRREGRRGRSAVHSIGQD